MANLRRAMDAAFWDQQISTPQTLEGSARSIPGDPFPMEATCASKALRIQQISFISMGLPLSLIPSLSPPPPPKDSSSSLGSFAFQSLLLRLIPSSDSWIGLVGQIKPKKLFNDIREEFKNAEEIDLQVLKDAARHILDKSLYAFNLTSQFSPTDSTSLLFSTEHHGHTNSSRYKFMLFHQLEDHDLSLEAGWPELFIDNKRGYWNVPESISLDLTSLQSESGFQYRVGLHKSKGCPEAVGSTSGEVPLGLLPGLCAKAAFSYEKSKDIWRVRETTKDVLIKTDQGTFWRPSYDVNLNEPHAAISGVIGGSCEAWLQNEDSLANAGDSLSSSKRSRLSADLFGSVCYTYQHGKFREYYWDLSRVDARLDICSASALAKRVFNRFTSSVDNADNPLSAPRLNLILQQQVAGPIVARIDSRVSLGSSSGKGGPYLEEVIYSLSYSLRLLRSGKVVAWYSPKRKEGMVELRLFEF